MWGAVLSVLSSPCTRWVTVAVPRATGAETFEAMNELIARQLTHCLLPATLAAPGAGNIFFFFFVTVVTHGPCWGLRTERHAQERVITTAEIAMRV